MKIKRLDENIDFGSGSGESVFDSKFFNVSIMNMTYGIITILTIK